MGLFDKKKEPILLKESDSIPRQIQELRGLLDTATPQMKQRIEQDIKLLEYGKMGEDCILFELKNSHIPMYILHDLYIEQGELNAQIDFAVVTAKIVFLIECKNLYGNIEINSKGDFIRTMQFGKQQIKEGIYSPITQNQRHLELLKSMKAEKQNNFLLRALAEKYFYDFHQGVVVLANPKTVLQDRYAKAEVKAKVIRADQLAEFIRQKNKASPERACSDKDMQAIAQRLLDLHRPNPKDYLEKYKEEPAEESLKEEQPAEPQQLSKLYRALRQWRYQQAQKEGLQAYHIFYNTTLDELVEKKPKNNQELLGITGLGLVKCQKYGSELLKIIEQFKES